MNQYYAVIDGHGRRHILTWAEIAEYLANGKLVVLSYSGPYRTKRQARRELTVEFATMPRHKLLKEC